MNGCSPNVDVPNKGLNAPYILRLILALSTMLAALAFPNYELAAQQDGTVYNPWPPYLKLQYSDVEPGKTLVKPIDHRVMRQMAEAVLRVARGAITHVDDLAAEASQTPDSYKRGERDPVILYGRPYEPRALVGNFLGDAGDSGIGISSISVVRAEMQTQHDRIREIATRYEKPIEIPRDPDAYQAFLRQQTEEAKAIHRAMDWSMRGREYVVQWVLNSLHYPDDELVAYQNRVNGILQEQRIELAERDFGLGRYETDRYLQLLGAAERDMEEPFAAEEKRFIDRHVARYMRLAEYTEVMLDQIGDQLVQLVDTTPPEWAEVPFRHQLYNPIRYRIFRFFPYGPNQRDFVSVYAEFYYPENIETRSGKAEHDPALHCRNGWSDCRTELFLTAPWDYMRDLAIPKEPPAEEPPAYPRYVVQYQPTVPEVVLWGEGNPSPATDDWSYLIPQAVIDEHELDGRWIVMAVYGQNLFDLEGQTPDLTWAAADKQLDYKLLHAGTFSVDKANGRGDLQWSDFWSSLGFRQSSRVAAGKPPLGLQHADVYVVAVRLAANTWAGPYSFKLGDLSVDWTLPNATNMAKTRFVRSLTEGGEILGNGDEFEPTRAVFKHDRFYVEIETSGDVVTDNRIPFELMVSRDGGPLSVVSIKSAGNQDITTFQAYRIGNNRRLYRSSRLFVQNPKGANAWGERDGVREAGIALAPGDRLVARVVPYGVARQAGMGMLRVFTTPAQVGAAWRQAVVQAANLIGVTPPRPWAQLSGDEFSAVLRSKWGTVDSTPFVRVGGRQIELKLGDLAAMLLIRQKFNEAMERDLPNLTALYHKAIGSRKNLPLLRETLRPDAMREGSPLGEIAVADPGGPLLTVPFRLVYDQEWLELAFRNRITSDAARTKWVDEVTVDAVTRYYEAAVASYRYSKGREIRNWVPDTSLDLADPKDMLKLTAIGMGRMADQIKPNLLRLVEAPAAGGGKTFRWEIDTIARSYVGTIQALGEEFHANEALIDQYNAMTMVVAGAGGLLLPEVAVARAIAAISSVGTMAATLTRELPEYFSRSADLQFALGAHQAIGDERYVAAALRHKPGWSIALELVGGTVDVIASLAQLRHAQKVWVAARADKEVAAIFAEGPSEFVLLPREKQQSALLRLAQLSDLQETGKTLSAFETTMLERGSQMLDDMGTFGDDVLPPRYLDPAAVETAQPIIMREGKIGFISPQGSLDLSETITEGVEAVAGPALRIPENRPWHIFDVKSRIGHGAYAQVYKIEAAGEASRALKVYERGQDGIDDVQRALRAEEILERGGIPQLKIIDSGVHDGRAYIVQEIMPEPGLYTPIEGVPMEEGMAKALLELYRKMGRKRIGWADGHSKNVYFFREVEDGPLIAGVLDQDRVWEIGQGIDSGVWGGNSNDLMNAIIRAPAFRKFGIRSLKASEYTPAALSLIQRGFSPWPDGEYFMMKMLEHKGWIVYDRNAGTFVSNRMDIRLAEEYFPKLRSLESIDTEFDVPAHLREGAPALPLGNPPDSR